MRPKRFRLYIDEIGDSATTQKSLRNDRYLTLAGVAFETEHYREDFQPKLELLKRTHLTYDPDRPPILHRHDIITRKGVFQVLKDPARRVAFYRDLASLIGSADFGLFCVVVDKKANIDRYGSACPEQYGYALAGLMPRYAGWLHYNVFGVGDVMAEARYKKADRSLSQVYRDIYEHGTRHYPRPHPQPARVIQRTVVSKSLKLQEKRFNIAGLQVADLVAFGFKVDTLRAHGKPAPHLEGFWRRLLSLVQPKYNRNLHRGGIIDGYGRIFIAPK